MGRLGRRLEANYLAVRDDIYKFCGALNYQPTEQQCALLDLVQTRRPRLKVACKSGKGPGKTKLSGVVALWWAIQAADAKIIVTAPTARQCEDIWLGELERTLKKADPWIRKIFEMTAKRVKICGKKQWGIQTMTATSKEAVLGFHETNLKVIVEEASGVDRDIIRALEDTLSNENSAILKIGNPTERDSDFFDCFHSKRHRWECLTFNAEDTPASSWFDPNRNVEILEEFGRESDPYRIAVLGEFPYSDPRCVLSSEDLEKLTAPGRRGRELLYAALKRSSRRQIGYDFARFGGDENTIYRRSGEAIVQWTRLPHTDPNDVAELGMTWQREAGWKDDQCWHVADSGGMGQGVMRRFYDEERQLHEFGFGQRAVNITKYANKITEAWFEFRKKVRAGTPFIPNDGLLIQQLSGRRYKMNNKMKLVLESKEDYVKRGHESPDRADGLVLAFYDAFLGASSAEFLGGPQGRMGARK